MIICALALRRSTSKSFSLKMLQNLIALAFAVFFIVLANAEEKCTVADPSKTLRLSIKTTRNQTGKWITEFTSRGGEGKLDISQNIVNCGGVEVVEIDGYLASEVDSERTAKHCILKDNKTEEDVPPQPLHFHERTGENIELSNGKRTAARRSYGVTSIGGSVITNRPLKDNELFEVQLDKIIDEWESLFSLGVTVANPTTVSFLDHWSHFKDGIWLYNFHSIYRNGKDIRSHLNTLKVGDRVGVMRKSNDSLHFFVNGTDQGAIPTTVLETVYGVLDVYGKLVQATIVKP